MMLKAIVRSQRSQSTLLCNTKVLNPRKQPIPFLRLRVVKHLIRATQSYYSPYTHYPQAMYNTNTYQYAAQQHAAASRQNTTANIPTAQPVTGTAGNTSNNNSGIDTADVATLNDALGSAGVDLRVSLVRFILIFNLLNYGRPKRRAYNGHMINTTQHTAPTKTAVVNNPPTPTSTPVSLAQACAKSQLIKKSRKFRKTPSTTLH